MRLHKPALDSRSKIKLIQTKMSDTQIIRGKLRRLLPTLDLETATQRTIQQQLEDELGISLENYKHVIKAEVDAWLLGVDPEELEQDITAPPELQEPPAKKPRKERTPASTSKPKPKPAPPANVMSPAIDSDGDEVNGPRDLSFSVPISKSRFVGIKSFKGRYMVDVREYYTKDGELAPGSKGLAMLPDQWQALTGGLLAINDALGRSDDTFYVDLGANKRAGVSVFGGKVMVSLREFYEKNGAMLPGKKGISLPPDQWAKLCAAHETMTSKLSTKLPGGIPSPPKPQRPVPAVPAAAPSPIPTTAQHAALASGSRPVEVAAPASASKGSPGSIVSIPLAPMRRAEVAQWKGKLVVDVREFYEKDGALAHTKKGLQMPPDQFEVLRNGASAISAALKAQDTSFGLTLANK